MNKQKSVSPVIATILLIVVVVAITALVLNWGVDFVRRSTDTADDAIDFSCMGADIKITSCSFYPSLNEMFVILTNTGNLDFPERNKFYAVITDRDDNFLTTEVDFDTNSLSVGVSTTATIENLESFTNPITLKINPSLCPNVQRSVTCREN